MSLCTSVSSGDPV